ncbi:MAG: glycosyltransferase [Bacillota bacterium]|nr:glycosyltransferase [Bacillota bacterium]
MFTVSLCMIVKDEEAVLARCLESVGDAADEIVIADTGSSDATREIAARYTDKVFHFPWTGNFSEARNFSFSKATMDFILWLDADDVLSEGDRAALIRMKQEPSDHFDVVMMPYHTAFDEDGKPIFSYYRERLIRKSIPFAWEGCVHEVIVHAGRTIYADIGVKHLSVKKSYSDRNLKIYEAQMEKGSPMSPRDRFYYGRELYYHKKYPEAKEVLKEFLASGQGWIENNIEACKILSYCHKETGDPAAAMEALTSSFRHDVPRAETCCEIAALWMEQKNYQAAIFWYQLALELPRQDTGGAFVHEDCYGFLPAIQLCVCYDRLGDLEKAKAYNRMAGSHRPHAPAYLQNLTYFERLSET